MYTGAQCFWSEVFVTVHTSARWVTAATPTSSQGVKTNFIKRSQARGPTMGEVINQRWNHCHGMCGAVGGFFGEASQKMTHAFPDSLVRFPCLHTPPSSGMSIGEKMSVVGQERVVWLLLTEGLILGRTQTNTHATHITAGKPRQAIDDTAGLYARKISDYSHAEIHTHARTIKGTHTHT